MPTMEKEKKFKYDPNKRGVFAPSSAQKEANKIVGKVGRNVVGMTGDIIKNSPVGIGARTASKVFAPVLEKGLEAVKEDAVNTKTFVAGTKPQDQIEDPAENARTFPATANAAELPGTTQENMQLSPSHNVGEVPDTEARTFPAARQPGTGFIKNEETGDVFSISGNKITGKDKDGNVIDKPTRAFTPAGPQEGTDQKSSLFSSGKDYKTDSGLQVSFDQNTSQEERQAFMRNPTQGTRQRSGLLDPGEQSVREKYFQASKDGRNKQDEKPIGWRERVANKRIDTGLESTKLQQEGANTRQEEQNAILSDKNEIDRIGTEAIAGERNAKAETLQQMNDLRSNILNETDPDKLAKLEEQYYALNGKTGGDTSFNKKARIDTSLKLAKMYDDKFAEDSFDQKPTDYIDAEASQPIPREVMYYRDAPEAARALYGEPSPEVQALLILNKSPEYWQKYQTTSPEGRRKVIENIIAQSQGRG